MLLETGGRILLYREPDGTVHEIANPPTSILDFRDASRELGLPEYVDGTGCAMQRAAITLWLATNAPSFMLRSPDAKKVGGPLNPLLMGGAAVKLLCPSANERSGPMNRKLKDLDYIVTRKEGSRFVTLLTNLGSVAGSRYHHFLTSGDRRFNAIRAGERYRVRSVDWTEDLEPIVNWVDILVDKIDMRHVVDVRDELEGEGSMYHTIGPEKLLMSKCQMITEIERKDNVLLENSKQEFRVLNCPWYRDGKLVIGMEEKDMMDACAILHDRFATEAGQSLERIKNLLSKDQRFLLTFRLNLENIVARFDFLRSKGITERQLSKIKQAVDTILKGLPAHEKKWGKPWWNTDVDTPVIA